LAGDEPAPQETARLFLRRFARPPPDDDVDGTAASRSGPPCGTGTISTSANDKPARRNGK